MAALSWTAGSVLAFGGKQETLAAGGAVVRGNVVRKTTTNTFVVAVNDSAANADAYGIALCDGGTGQPITVQVLTGGGEVEGATFAVGKVYVLGTAGATIPIDDVAGAEFITVVGIGRTAARLVCGKVAGTVAAAGAVA